MTTAAADAHPAPASARSATALPPLPPLATQADRLVELGIHRLAGLSPAQLREAAARLPATDRPALLTVHPSLARPSELAPLLRRGERAGFVVVDMTDVDQFAPVDGLEVPAAPLYLVADAARGDEYRNWSPNEALPAIGSTGRRPMLLSEGILWLLQQPGVLEPNACFMTIGSRLRRDTGRLDARTPAIWISNGVGRDGRQHRGAPKVGWCWAGNRHTWLGIASVAARLPLSRLSG